MSGMGRAPAAAGARRRQLASHPSAPLHRERAAGAHLAADQDVALDAVIDLVLVQLEARRLAVRRVRVGVGVVPHERRQLALLRHVHVHRELAPLAHRGGGAPRPISRCGNQRRQRCPRARALPRSAARWGRRTRCARRGLLRRCGCWRASGVLGGSQSRRRLVGAGCARAAALPPCLPAFARPAGPKAAPSPDPPAFPIPWRPHAGGPLMPR